MICTAWSKASFAATAFGWTCCAGVGLAASARATVVAPSGAGCGDWPGRTVGFVVCGEESGDWAGVDSAAASEGGMIPAFGRLRESPTPIPTPSPATVNNHDFII